MFVIVAVDFALAGVGKTVNVHPSLKCPFIARLYDSTGSYYCHSDVGIGLCVSITL